MMSPRDMALRRVRSLLRLADPKRNSSPGERSNARRLASKLIRKWGFKNSELAGDEPDGERLAETDFEQPVAYCGRCSALRNFRGVHCRSCGRPIWELCGRLNSTPVRTTRADYGRLERVCVPIHSRRLKA